MIPAGRLYRTVERRDGRLWLNTAAVTDPAAEAVAVLEPELVGVCRSDLRELANDRYLRRDFGHEIVGRIIASRPEGLFIPGQRVVYDPHPELERTCGFAELVELSGSSQALRAALVPVGDAVAPVAAVFAEPLACAVHCVRRLEVASQARGIPGKCEVAILGAGTAGALIAATLLDRDVPVRLLNRSPARVEFLHSKGFLPAHALGEPAVSQRFPRVVLATAVASPEALRRATELVEPGGLLLVFAGTGPETTISGTPLDPVRRQEQLVGVEADGHSLYVAGTHGAVTEDFHDSLALLSPSHVCALAERVEELVTDVLTLQEATEVLPRHIGDGFLGKIIVRPSQ